MGSNKSPESFAWDDISTQWEKSWAVCLAFINLKHSNCYFCASMVKMMYVMVMKPILPSQIYWVGSCRKSCFYCLWWRTGGKKLKFNNVNLGYFALLWFGFNCYVLVLQFISVSCSFSCSRKCLEITTAIEITAGCGFQGKWKERDKEVWLLNVTDFYCLHSTQEHKTVWQH